MKLIKLVGSIS